MPHFCLDEFYALLMMVPFLGWLVAWLRSRPAVWRARHAKPVCVHADKDSHPEPVHYLFDMFGHHTLCGSVHPILATTTLLQEEVTCAACVRELG